MRWSGGRMPKIFSYYFPVLPLLLYPPCSFLPFKIFLIINWAKDIKTALRKTGFLTLFFRKPASP